MKKKSWGKVGEKLEKKVRRKFRKRVWKIQKQSKKKIGGKVKQTWKNPFFWNYPNLKILWFCCFWWSISCISFVETPFALSEESSALWQSAINQSSGIENVEQPSLKSVETHWLGYKSFKHTDYDVKAYFKSSMKFMLTT